MQVFVVLPFTFSTLLLLLLVNAQVVVKIPEDLDIGTAVSSFQVEGAWDKDGKRESIWDYYTHYNKHKIEDESNGDVACDSYHKIKEDVGLLKSLGVKFYRFSLSWTRIMVNDFSNRTNEKGITYYNNLIDELLANNIEPMVTIYHWDLPQRLQNFGGFANSGISDWFENFAQVVFSEFGDRVKTWVTINEPRQICHSGYGSGRHAPGYSHSGIGDYICDYNVLKAHARMYRLYEREFKEKQNGKVGLIVDFPWAEPASNSKEDIEAALRHIEFNVGLYTNPVFSKDGDFPKVVKDFVAKRSKLEGFKKSRLPEFTDEEIEDIKGTSDFYGLNYYTSYMIKHAEISSVENISVDNDIQVTEYQCDNWPSGTISIFRSVPWGLRKALNFVKNTYNNPDIYILETGFSDTGQVDDIERIAYFKSNLEAVTQAITMDQVALKKYTIWSLMDNFEWGFGYTVKFGIYHVNFNSTERTRTAKSSAKFFKELLETKQFEKAAEPDSNICLRSSSSSTNFVNRINVFFIGFFIVLSIKI